jgi:hypothetical protein
MSYYEGSDTAAAPAGEVDLRLVLAFSRGGTGGAELLLELADKSVRLRFQSGEDAGAWRAGMMAWKDWAIDFAMYCGEDAFAVPGAGADGGADAGDSDAAYAARLDGILVGVEEDEGEGASLTRASSSEGNAGASSKGRAAPAPATRSSLADRPAPLRGWLEKKAPGKVAGSSWQRRYCRVDEATHQLVYYKSER